VIEENSKLRWGLLISFLFIQIPTIRTYFKYISPEYHFMIPIIYACIFFIFWCYFQGEKLYQRTHPLIKSPQLTLFFAIMLVVISYYGFHYELYLQTLGALKSHGSDSANCLITPAMNLLRGHYPYKDASMIFHNPISPGPGWVIMNLPFTSFGLYGPYYLLIPFWLLLTAWVIGRYTQHNYYNNLYLILSFCAISFWELLCSGIDLIAVGCLMVLSVLALDKVAMSPKKWPFYALILFSSASATARIAFFYWPALLGFLLMSRDVKRGWQFAILGSLAVLIWHGSFYIVDPSHYFPLHLLGKANFITNNYYKAAGMVATLTVGLWILFNRRSDVVNWLWISWLSMITPLSVIAMGDLFIWRHWDVTTWEGVNYISVTIPVLIAWIVLKFSLERSTVSQREVSNVTELGQLPATG